MLKSVPVINQYSAMAVKFLAERNKGSLWLGLNLCLTGIHWLQVTCANPYALIVACISIDSFVFQNNCEYISKVKWKTVATIQEVRRLLQEFMLYRRYNWSYLVLKSQEYVCYFIMFADWCILFPKLFHGKCQYFHGELSCQSVLCWTVIPAGIPSIQCAL